VRTAISKKKIHENLVSSTVVYPHFAEEKKQFLPRVTANETNFPMEFQ
jgi:hypothetical protein